MRLLLLLLALLCTGTVHAQSRLSVDTRQIIAFAFDMSAAVELDSAARVRAPLETGFCLKGKISAEAIRITSAPVAQIHHADTMQVTYLCDRRDPAFIGVAHTHTQPTSVCVPSEVDFMPLLLDANNVYVSVIVCLHMTSQFPPVYMQLRDGRWAWLQWAPQRIAP